MTARDLIARALRSIGGLAAGETPSGAEELDAYATLNDLVDAWATQRLTIYQVCRQVFPLVNGQGTYTIGVGGEFDHARPLWIDHAGLLTTQDNGEVLELPLELLTTQDWAEESGKDGTSSLPTALYNDYAYPWSSLTVFPAPDTSGLEIALYLPTAVTAFADLSTDYDLPPGYARALRYNLAVELAPEWGRPLDPVVSALAVESLAWVKRANKRHDHVLSIDPALIMQSEAFNWLTGE